MARTPRQYPSIVTKLAFLSLNGSDAAKAKAELILWTLREAGVKEERIEEIVAESEQLADEGTE